MVKLATWCLIGFLENKDDDDDGGGDDKEGEEEKEDGRNVSFEDVVDYNGGSLIILLKKPDVSQFSKRFS